MSHEIGLASFDIQSNKALISQFVDSQTFVRLLHLIHILDPIQIIMPPTKHSRLEAAIADAFDIPISIINRSYFNDVNGLNCINSYSVNDLSVPELEKKFYGLSSLGALFK
jgi:DNA mismatch repair protein MSH4